MRRSTDCRTIQLDVTHQTSPRTYITNQDERQTAVVGGKGTYKSASTDLCVAIECAVTPAVRERGIYCRWNKGHVKPDVRLVLPAFYEAAGPLNRAVVASASRYFWRFKRG